MKLLIKIPSRERPEKLIQILNEYHNKSTVENTSYLITLDEDDIFTNNDSFKAKLKSFDRTSFKYGLSKNKIHAINRDLNEYEEDWDVLLLASDDMLPCVNGYDEIILKKMEFFYPEGDGVLWFNDGYRGKELNTLPILDKKYYNRFKYIYHPDYISVYADNEFMDVANILNKQTYFDEVIIKHVHPSNIKVEMDSLYKRNESFYNKDNTTYLKRKSIKFNL